MPRASRYRRDGMAQGGGVYRGTDYRYVPEPTNNAHVVAWLIHERNSAPATPALAPRLPASLPPSLVGHVGGAARPEKPAWPQRAAWRRGDDGQQSKPSNSPGEVEKEAVLVSGQDDDAERPGARREDWSMDLLGKVRRLRELDQERARLADEVRGDPDVASLLALLWLELGASTSPPSPERERPRLAAVPAAQPRAPVAGLSRRARIRQALAEQPERLWRMQDVAGAIGEQPEKKLASELVALHDMGELERVEAGVYRWAGKGACA